jgi:hypothetical protein
VVPGRIVEVDAADAVIESDARERPPHDVGSASPSSSARNAADGCRFSAAIATWLK